VITKDADESNTRHNWDQGKGELKSFEVCYVEKKL
jgi:hypothetical protein